MQPTEQEMTEGEDGEKAKRKASALAWASRIEAAKTASKNSWEDAKEAWKELMAGRTERVEGATPTSDNDTRYPIYWSSVKNVQPMLYSRTPIPVGEKTFDDLEDNIARLSCLALERLSKHLMRGNPFDRVMMLTRDTFIHAGKAAPRVYCESKITSDPVKIYYSPSQVLDPQTQQPLTVWTNNKGDTLTGEVELIQDETGYYIESPDEKIEKVEVKLAPIHYRDVLHNPDARYQDEVEWIAYGEWLTKRDVNGKFGAGTSEKLTFTTGGKEEDKVSSGEKLLKTPKVRIWEIWDKGEKEVYWFAEGYNDELLVADGYDGDPYELYGFFPSPAFILGTTGPDDMFPLPDFIQLRPMIEQLHGLYRRLRRLVRATRRRGLYDNKVEELNVLSDALDEAEWVGVANFKELIGEGGLENIIKTLDVSELTDAIKEVVAVSEQLEAKFNELYGIPDIMRGVSDPNETASAQQQKGKYISLRASSPMQEFQRLCRDTIELMLDLALKKFPDDKLVDLVGVRHWEPEDQQLWPQVLTLIRDDQERKVRINIETDSTVTMNENAEIEQRNYLAQTISQVVDSIGQVAQFAPEMKPVVMKTMQLLVRGVRAGKQVEEELNKAFETAMQPQPEKPDPEMMKAQADAQLKAQMQQAELQFKQMELETNTQLKLKQMELETQKLQLQMQQLAAQNQVDAYKVQADAMTAAFDKKLDAIRIDIEKQYVAMDMKEKFMEEARLRGEQQAAKAEGSKASAPAQVHISHGPPKANRRRATMQREDGSKVTIDVEDIHDNMTEVPIPTGG